MRKPTPPATPGPPRLSTPLAAQLELLRRRPQSLLFTDAAWKTIESVVRPVADFCPHFLLFEFELGEFPASKVDFSFGLSAFDSTGDLLARKKLPKADPWRPLKDFCLGWLSSPDLPRDIRMFGFECDAPSGPGAPPLPGLWVQTQRPRLNAQLSVMRELLGPDLLAKKDCDGLRRFINRLPADVNVPFIGLVLGRGKREFRAELTSRRPGAGLGILPRLAIDLPKDELALIKALFRDHFKKIPDSMYSVQIRYGSPPALTGVSVNTLETDKRPDKAVRLLNALTGRVHFNSDWTERLLLWPWEDGETRQFVSHLKMAYKPDRGLVLKAYLGLMNKKFYQVTSQFREPSPEPAPTGRKRKKQSTDRPLRKFS